LLPARGVPLCFDCLLHLFFDLLFDLFAVANNEFVDR